MSQLPTPAPRLHGSPIRLARAALVPLFAALVLAAGSPVLLVHGGHRRASGLVQRLFARVCHQRPERTFQVGGAALAVCQRCSGIYLGLLVGVSLPAALLRVTCARRRREWALLGLGLVGLDVGLSFAGIHPATAISRFGSGLVLGVVLASLALAGLTETAPAEVTGPWRRDQGSALVYGGRRSRSRGKISRLGSGRSPA